MTTPCASLGRSAGRRAIKGTCVWCRSSSSRSSVGALTTQMTPSPCACARAGLKRRLHWQRTHLTHAGSTLSDACSARHSDLTRRGQVLRRFRRGAALHGGVARGQGRAVVSCNILATLRGQCGAIFHAASYPTYAIDIPCDMALRSRPPLGAAARCSTSRRDLPTHGETCCRGQVPSRVQRAVGSRAQHLGRARSVALPADGGAMLGLLRPPMGPAHIGSLHRTRLAPG